MDKNEIVLFETLDKEIMLPVIMQNDTVWLTSNQMAGLFGRDEKTIRKHVNNVFRKNEVDYENNTQKMLPDLCYSDRFWPILIKFQYDCFRTWYSWKHQNRQGLNPINVVNVENPDTGQEKGTGT